jgi:hypothetical protein
LRGAACAHCRRRQIRKIPGIAASAGKRPRSSPPALRHHIRENSQAGRPRIAMEQLLAPITMPRIGLGTWAIGGWMWGGSDEADSIRTIRAALIAAATITNPIGLEFMAPPVGLLA